MAKFIFSNDLHKFAKQIVWFDSPERNVSDKFAFLAFIMAKSPLAAYEHAKRTFGFTNDDFKEALKHAKAGLFVYPEEWEKWNKVLGIEPALPMPERKWGEGKTTFTTNF